MNVGERVQRNGQRGTVIRVTYPLLPGMGAPTIHVIWDDGKAEPVHASTVTKVGPVTIHMTATEARVPGEWRAFCRCPWTSETFPTQEAARAAGDQHLKEANG